MIRYLRKMINPMPDLPERFQACRDEMRRLQRVDYIEDDDPLERTVELPLPNEWPY